MGHRLTFNAPQIFEPDSDRGWNQVEQPYMPMARVSASENSSLIHLVDNIPVQGGHFTSQWNSAPRSNGYPSSILNREMPHYQPQAPSSSCDPFLHQSGSGNFHFLHSNYSHHSSLDNISGQTAPGDDNAFLNQTMGNGRGPYKRKSPVNPPVCDGGSTSRYYDVGSSSHVQLHSDPWEEVWKAESYNTSWECPPTYRANILSIGNEGAQRNVRSRAEDVETNMSKTHLSCNSSFSSRTYDPSTSMDAWGQNSNASTREWNHNLTLPPVRVVTHGSDSSYFTVDPDPLNLPNNHPSGSMEFGSNNITPNINSFPQNVNSNSNQSVGGFRSGYGHRSVPSFRASSSNFHPGCSSALDEGIRIAEESYTSKHRRAFPSIRMRNMDRVRRILISSDRHRSSNEEESFDDQATREALMVSGRHSEFYESQNPFDQHGDMRLDTENMSYEELLALGERIGIVSTGLSDDSVSKCLTASIYCSSDTFQDEETCVICLEEYKNMDDVGSLKACGHDFHVGCIRKWLLMKNLCPICKATALDDNLKNRSFT